MSKRFFFILIALMAVALIGCNEAENVLKDPRDGRVYKTTTIGAQTWMAENLDYEIADSYCYNNDTSNCKKYGRLYTRDAALKACPAGWHLPSMEEFRILIKTVGGEKLRVRN
ncbi:FISUMP domain-containing protein [Fibrobacter sp. UBA3718]|uniref:FISUMP domain-containing protein n=1 Tax=Fibrobacter sp. UBA3718 TaxID=1946531 RepID=UPI0025C18796|nr:FISUMP domain-containing protein [Fibrobacter sp. UBA3718]